MRKIKRKKRRSLDCVFFYETTIRKCIILPKIRSKEVELFIKLYYLKDVSIVKSIRI